MTAVGVPFDGRGARTDDHLAAMRAIWTQPGPVEHHGPFVDFSGVDAHPRPVQPGGPRIVVGGHTRPAFRRAVAHGHGWYGFALTPEGAAHCVEELRRAACEVERPNELGALEISATPRHRLLMSHSVACSARTPLPSRSAARERASLRETSRSNAALPRMRASFRSPRVHSPA